MTKIIPASRTIIKLFVLISAVLGAPSVKDDAIIHVQDELQSLVNCKTSQDYPNLASFELNPRGVPSGDSACLSFRVFKEMGFVQLFHIPVEKLSRFILLSQKGYRDVPYHSWTHGFAVFHFTFAVLKNCKDTENDCFTPLEGLALLTAAMCHDLDHPGTNSQYQIETNSAMAQAYREKGSILERHHIEKTFKLLRDPVANFVAQLPERDHRKFMQLVSQIVLATDLTRHFKALPEEQEMAREGFDGANERHRHLLRSAVISSADLSDITKNWATARRSAKLVNTEFFYQGDEEKKMGLAPAKIMDRNQANIAEEQANFIAKVVTPLLRVLATICPEAQVCIDSAENNLKYWQNAIPHFEEQSKKGRDQLDILDDTELDQIPTTVRGK